jgi:hypothetical protein
MADTDAFDIGGGAEQSVPGHLAILNRNLEEAVALEEAVERMESDLKATKGALHVLKTKTIPDLMAEMMMDEIVWNGWKAKINDFVSGALPQDPERRARAIAWLESHEAGALIKTEVSVAFGKSQHNEAMAIAADIEAAGFAPSVSSGVHSATLQAFARERIKNGDPIDTEALGLYVGKVVKLGRVKR